MRLLIRERIRKNIPNILILIVVLILCVFISEMLLRFIYPLEYDIEREHMLSDWGIFLKRPNMEFIYFREEFSQDIKLNSKGLRDYEYGYEKNDSAYRIIMVGDSFVEGFEVELDKTFSKLLENKLKQDGDYEVINFGHGGFGLIPQAVLIEEEVINYNPDLIILNYYIGNDLTKIDFGTYNRFPEEFWLEEKHDLLKEKVYEKKTGTIIKNFLRRHFVLYYLIKKNLINTREENTALEASPIYEKDYSDRLKENLETSDIIFKFLEDFTSENEIKFVVVLIPTKEQVDERIFKNFLGNESVQDYDLERPQRLIKNLLEENYIEYVDLLPYLRENNINNTFYWEKDGHFNENGHEIVAEVIYRNLEVGGD